MSTGWTWDYVLDYITVARLKTMNAYWAINPPTHVVTKLLAKYIGYEFESDAPAKETDLGDLAAMVGIGG